MRQDSQPSVFIGLVDIASYYSGLKQGFDSLGVDCVFVSLSPNKFARQIVTNPRHWVLSFVNFVVQHGESGFKSRLASLIYHRFIFPLAKLVLLLWVSCRCNIFIFGFSSTFFNYRELPFLRLLGKKVIYVFNGTDSRPPYISGNFIGHHCHKSLAECSEIALGIKTKLRIIERFANVCVNHPPQAHFHAKKFVNHCYIGHPCRLQQNLPNEAEARHFNSLRIVHAPSNPGPKGTELIREMINLLRDEGHSIEYVELIGRSNEEVLFELERCDFVIDELYSDISLAGLGTEAAFFGKPAVVGGYAQSTLAQFASRTRLPMQLYVHPRDVIHVVRKLIVDADFRKAIGIEAQCFVYDHWAPDKVAQRFLQLARGDVPSEWWFDPESIDYLFGWGVSDLEVRNFLSALVAALGSESLHLADNPVLESKFLMIAGSTSRFNSESG
jgi:hypothetical protein